MYLIGVFGFLVGDTESKSGCHIFPSVDFTIRRGRSEPDGRVLGLTR